MSSVAGDGDVHVEPRGRVVFLIRLKPDSVDSFLAAYEDVRHQVASGVQGHVLDQVCQSSDDPDEWLITSEWDSLDRFLDWERSPEHRTLIKPMRDCIAEARSLRFHVRQETSSETLV